MINSMAPPQLFSVQFTHILYSPKAKSILFRDSFLGCSTSEVKSLESELVGWLSGQWLVGKPDTELDSWKPIW